MNTADITCVKMTENNNSKNNNCKQSILDIELQVLDELRDRYSSNWFNRVYLCYEDVHYNQPNDALPIKGFKCYKYNSFENANTGWDKDFPEYNKMTIRSTMIPICKWVPQIFDKYILNWKLRNMYWLGNHTLWQRHNRYSKEK
jgi:hypothetical protein